MSITFSTKKSTTTFTSKEVLIGSKADAYILETIEILNPELWGIDQPNLYDVEVKVLSENSLLDSQTLKTGIRKAELKADGFYLNDQKVFINGTNRHQEYPYIGYALSDEANYRDAVKIKNAGFDFVRLSHYPHSESL